MFEYHGHYDSNEIIVIKNNDKFTIKVISQYNSPKKELQDTLLHLNNLEKIAFISVMHHGKS